jgi:hypothetical protein
MRIEQREIFSFEELDERAKERAREWYRKVSEGDNDWAICVKDDCEIALELLGFKIDEILFSGFWSQGDGACFTGTWSAKDVNQEKVNEQYSRDGENNLSLALEFADIAKRFPEASATLKHHGMYYHENSVEIDCGGFEKEQETEQGDVPVWCHTDEQNFQDFARDCMRWIYRSLEAAYDWQNADEQVDENIVANGYEFTKEGERV